MADWDTTTTPLYNPAGWTSVGYDDSAWTQARVCQFQNVGEVVNYYASINGTTWDDLRDLRADGARSIWTSANCGTPYTPWYYGLFRLTFSTPRGRFRGDAGSARHPHAARPGPRRPHAAHRAPPPRRPRTLTGLPSRRLDARGGSPGARTPPTRQHTRSPPNRPLWARRLRCRLVRRP